MTGTRGKVIGIALLLVAVFSLSLTGNAGAYRFAPDPGFGAGGTVDLLAVNQPGRTFYGVHEVRPGPEGTAWVLYRALPTPEQSECETPSYISRYLSDGRVDTGFGAGGFAQIYSPIGCTYPSLHVDRQFRPLITWRSTGGSRGPSTLAIARYTADGALDPTFGSAGVSLLTIPCPGGAGANLDSGADGGLLLGFGCWADESSPEATSTSPYQSYIARLLPNGALDSGFDGDGLLAPSREAGWGGPKVAAVEADGSVILAQTTDYVEGSPQRSRLLRLLSDGTLDGTYQARAEVSLRRLANIAAPSIPELMTDFLLRRNGDLVVGGGSDRGGWVATLRHDGSLQREFSGDGFRRFSEPIRVVAADRHGGLLLLGWKFRGLSILRLLADGNRDRTVGGPRGQRLLLESEGSLSDFVSLWRGRPLFFLRKLGGCSSRQDCEEPAELRRLRLPERKQRR
ncbi:MAG TPA: hypothetical protein VFU16_07220 [Solirubrobacterales bacterium]|nr:hypothetical protein [Solirubrobacterales bacterium]